jgi:hypothetical protein
LGLVHHVVLLSNSAAVERFSVHVAISQRAMLAILNNGIVLCMLASSVQTKQASEALVKSLGAFAVQLPLHLYDLCSCCAFRTNDSPKAGHVKSQDVPEFRDRTAKGPEPEFTTKNTKTTKGAEGADSGG